MKHRYIDSLLSEIQQLALRVENLKESKKVPFSFFKDSFKHTQEVTRLLHELEFVQIEEMKGKMEKLVQFLSDEETNKREVKTDAEVTDGKTNEKEVSLKMEEETSKTTDANDKVEQKKEPLAEAEQVVSRKVEHNDKQTNLHNTFVETNQKATQPTSALLNSKIEKVLADFTPKNKSLNDVQPVSQTIQDVKRSISLNDRFLFQRELFDNNREEMDTMLTKLQSFSSFDLVESYLERNTNWDFRDGTVKKFLQMLKDTFK